MTERNFPDWLQAYMVYTAHTLPPNSFHQWVGTSVIASALQRKVYIRVNMDYNCYPNDYIVLIGPPGSMKSTAMRIGRSILSKITPQIKMSSDSVTREKLIVNISQANRDGHSSFTIHSTEFASFVSSSKEDMITFLTDIYDSPPDWVHDTKTGGQNKIQAPCLNLLAATTPDSMMKEVPVETSGQGLSSRIIFVHEQYRRDGSWREEEPPGTAELKERLIADLTKIASLKGEYHVQKDADQFYDAWFRSQAKTQNPTNNPTLNPYFARKHTHILKLAMIIAAAQRDELVIYLDDFHRAFAYIEAIEANMAQIFTGIGKNVLAPTMENIWLFLLDYDKSNPVPISTLMDMFRSQIRKDELTEILETLQLSGKIGKVSTTLGPSYYGELG